MADELGYVTDSVLSSWSSLAPDENETNPELMWPKSIETYDRMRREDAQVGSVVRAVTLPLRRATWSIDPAGAKNEIVEFVAAELGLPIKGRAFVAPPRSRDRFSWDEHLRLALLSLVFGHSVFEQVYRFDGARFGLSKLAWRPPRTITKFDVARDGGLIAIEQGSNGTTGTVRIPIDRLVVYVNEREGANWIGQSLLRQAYKNHLLKDRLLRSQAMTVERNGLGIPVYTGAELPDVVAKDDAAREKWLKVQRDDGLKIARALRAGKDAGASIPNSANLTLLGVSGKLPDTDGPIRYHDEQIARAVLAHFLNLGTETGSWALGSTFANFFTDSLNAVSNFVAGVAQQHIVEDLVDINWGSEEPAPRIVPTAIGEEQAATADAILALINAGAIYADESLEAFMRERYRLPVKDENPAPVEQEQESE